MASQKGMVTINKTQDSTDLAMAKNNLLEKVKGAGFENLEGFVKMNLRYLPENKQRLFYSIADIDNVDYSGRNVKDYSTACYSGKD